jgi:formylglycine-generating enzyme required for sulfatase activity
MWQNRIQKTMNILSNSINYKILQKKLLGYGNKALRESVARQKVLSPRYFLGDVDLGKPSQSSKRLVADTSKNKIPFKMIYCPSGQVVIGGGRVGLKKKIKKIKQSFMLSETEITQELYISIMGDDGRLQRKNYKRPITNITWFDAIMFCNKLSIVNRVNPYYTITDIKYGESNKANIVHAKVDINPSSNGFRLPTEAEWEYAAKAGTTNKWPGCNKDSDLIHHTWYYQNSNVHRHDVKTLKPNEWGFYDMCGNVWEYCFDLADVRKGKRKADHCDSRILKGGCYGSDEYNLEISNYIAMRVDGKQDEVGFRIAHSLVV